MSGPVTAEVEHVVLLDDLGRAVGRARKADVHGPDTPLHLAFSCYVFDTEQRLLLTQRAWHKVTWPGVWTNTCCGHPAPGEPFVEAVRRRTQEELGLVLDDLRLLLPEFRYRVAMADGTVENELCPVFVASTAGPVRADPAEVAAHRWEPWAAWRDDVVAGRADVSPWSVLQVGALPAEPYAAPAADPARLPPAARGVEVRAGLELRPATEEDVDFLTDLVLEVTRDQGRFPADADEGEYRAGFAAWTREQLAGELPGSTTYVLRRGDERVGRLRLVRTEEQTELAGIQLRPDAQGRGLGTALVRSLQEEGRPVTLGVERDNPRARALYARLGFALVGQDDRDHLLRWEPPAG
jgi:isopentenyl-diphosphate delta-isomerase